MKLTDQASAVLESQEGWQLHRVSMKSYMRDVFSVNKGTTPEEYTQMGEALKACRPLYRFRLGMRSRFYFGTDPSELILRVYHNRAGLEVVEQS